MRFKRRVFSETIKVPAQGNLGLFLCVIFTNIKPLMIQSLNQMLYQEIKFPKIHLLFVYWNPCGFSELNINPCLRKEFVFSALSIKQNQNIKTYM